MSEESVMPVERIGRGALLALAVIPLGVAAWLVLWNFNFIASIVAFGIAWAAYVLYKFGSGGAISKAGASAILAIVVATLLMCFFAGMVLDAATQIGDVNNLTTWAAFTHPQFWGTFWDAFPGALSDYKADFAIAAGFGALGSFRMLRGAFTEGAR